MKKSFVIIALCIGSLLVIGCAGTAKKQPVTGTAILPEIDVVQVKETSEEALKVAQETKLDIDVAGNKLMEMDNKLTALSEDVSTVSLAKIEEIENRLALLVEAFKDLQAQVTAIRNAPASQAAATKSGPLPTFSPRGATEIILAGSSEYDAYQNALRVFNGRNYEQAQKLFSDIVRQYPQGAYGDNCYYWIGESFYAMRDWASSIAALKKVFEYKNSSKADDAQLKIGMPYLKMGQAALAKTEFKTLVDRYPASEYVGRAQKLIADIK
jgi:tol-pal system protein YbgF